MRALDEAAIRRRSVLLVGGVLLLGLLHTSGHVLEKALGLEGDLVRHYRLLTSMDDEMNLPTWFSVLLLAGAGMMTVRAARELGASLRSRITWTVVGATLLVLSLDELATFHEKIGLALEARSDALTALPFNSWIVVYAVLAAGFAAFVVPLLREVPPDVRRALVGAGSIYVAGAAGFELVAGLLADVGYHRETLIGQVSVLLEESFELLGVIVYVAALEQYLAARTVPSKRSPALVLTL